MESTTQFAIPKPHTLNGLPVELILSISDLLELADILCLSMCNRQLFGALSRQRKPILPTEDPEDSRLEVLDRIVRDMPNHFLCYPCNVLHKFDGPEWFAKTFWSEWPSRLPCVYQYEWDRNPIISHIRDILLWSRRRIYSGKLRLVMRWLYYGAQYGLGTESLYHNQVREHPESTTLFSIEAQCHPEQKGLCLRIQDILIVDNRRMDLFVLKYLRSPLHQSPPHFFWICEHLSHRGFLDIVKSMLSAYIPKKSMPPSRGNCDKCNTDFDLQLKEVGHKIALILTKWIILGPGPELNDPDWGFISPEHIWRTVDREEFQVDRT